jgi:Zn finger protein HypA/HybF involved in hydrogenase expression
MGDAAEMAMVGAVCEQCGVALDGTAPGYPRKCSECRGVSGPRVRKVKCPQCQRRVRATGLQDHLRDAHDG